MIEKDSVPEADGTRIAETQPERDRARGGEPIRKRAYHRALKRGEQWALNRKMMLDTIAGINRATKAMYERMDRSVWLENLRMQARSPDDGAPIAIPFPPKYEP